MFTVTSGYLSSQAPALRNHLSDALNICASVSVYKALDKEQWAIENMLMSLDMSPAKTESHFKIH